MLISVVCPVYNCAPHLEELKGRIQSVFENEKYTFELIFVCDDSPDKSWLIISELAEADARVKGIKLSRNFGQHNAITAGLDYCCGDWVVVMDCDLQDRPEEIPRMINKAIKGWSIVLARREVRKDSLFKKMGSKIFYKILSWMTGQAFDPAIANFGVYHSSVIDELRKMPEQNRFFPLFIKWLGFSTAAINVEHSARAEDSSAYSIRKLMALAFDSMLAYSNKPLRVGVAFGFVLAGSSMIYALFLIFRYLNYGVEVEGWTSVMVSIYFLSGIMLSMVGIVGVYVGKVFDETKARPLYVISEKVNAQVNVSHD